MKTLSISLDVPDDKYDEAMVWVKTGRITVIRLENSVGTAMILDVRTFAQDVTEDRPEDKKLN